MVPGRSRYCCKPVVTRVKNFKKTRDGRTASAKTLSIPQHCKQQQWCSIYLIEKQHQASNIYVTNLVAENYI